MARLRWTTLEDEEESCEMARQATSVSTRPAGHRMIRSRASSTSSDSEIEPLKRYSTPKTPVNDSGLIKKVRLVHLDSLKKFSQSPTKATGNATTAHQSTRTPRTASRNGKSLATRHDGETLRIQSCLSSGVQKGSDAEQGSRCGSHIGPSELGIEPLTARHTRPCQTVASRLVDSEEPDSLLELSGNLQSLKIIDDSQDRWDKASVSETRGAALSDKENHDAVIRFSPTRLKSRAKKITEDGQITPPPASPTKSRLQSPSKKAARVPTPPGRPSLDSFWDAQGVNAWHDRHSPQKPLQSPRKRAALHERLPSISPKKSEQAARAARKLFVATRHALAAAFLAELDQTITAGQIHALSASTGGVQLVWSPTLTTTAGRASWRRERPRPRAGADLPAPSPPLSPSPSAPPVTTPSQPAASTIHQEPRHFATIELATKIIDSPERLYNTLAHEFCHLANFMISEVRDQPHGKSFRAWGRRVSEAFADRGVEVTTKHTFEIEYKYMWRCGGSEGITGTEGGDQAEKEDEERGAKPGVGCGTEYQRHSKSIDPRRQRCGACRGLLVQVRPAPRRQGTDVGGYAAFVKRNFRAVREGMPAGASHKTVMEALGARYRAERGAGARSTGEGLRPPVPGDRNGEDGEGGEHTRRTSHLGAEHVVRTLGAMVLSDEDEDGE